MTRERTPPPIHPRLRIPRVPSAVPHIRTLPVPMNPPSPHQPLHPHPMLHPRLPRHRFTYPPAPPATPGNPPTSSALPTTPTPPPLPRISPTTSLATVPFRIRTRIPPRDLARRGPRHRRAGAPSPMHHGRSTTAYTRVMHHGRRRSRRPVINPPTRATARQHADGQPRREPQLRAHLRLLGQQANKYDLSDLNGLRPGYPSHQEPNAQPPRPHPSPAETPPPPLPFTQLARTPLNALRLSPRGRVASQSAKLKCTNPA
jgi:hypothetical protein